MHADQLLAVRDQLDSFLAQFHPHFIRREQRDQFALYSRGRLGPLARKSLEPIALAEDRSPRTLQQFLDIHRWDEDAMLDTHQRLVAQHFGDPQNGVFIADATSDAKKGTHTAGVARQYCGETGKIDNCIVTMHWAYAGLDDSHVLLDGELFVPLCWDPSAGEEALARRADAAVPDEARHKTHVQMSTEQLRRIRQNGVPGRFATGDCEFGGCLEWREAVAGEGLIYVAEVPRSMRGWWRAPRFHAPGGKKGGRGRKPSRPEPDIVPRSVEALVRFINPGFEPWNVNDSTKGPEVWRVARLPFFAAHGARPGQAQPGTLLVADNVLTGERKFFLTNAPADMATGQLLRVAFSRWRVERCFEDAKGELGLNHAETRSYKSLKRHLILTCVLHLFLTLLRREWGKKDGGLDVAASGPGRGGNAGGAVQVRIGGRETARDRGQTRPAPGAKASAQRSIKTLGHQATTAGTARQGHRSLRHLQGSVS